MAEDVTSPSYTIVSEYSGRLPLYHMDAYRLDGDDDFLALGVEDYLYGRGVCLVEWSERVEASIPPSAGRVTIEVLPTGARRLLVEGAALEEMLR